MKNILVTGGQGFIGSRLAWKLSQEATDDYNITTLDSKTMNPDEGIQHLSKNPELLDFVFHFGGISDTYLQDKSMFDRNLEFSKKLFQLCNDNKIPILYASSAATYGNGKHGFKDAHNIPSILEPENEYAKGKNEMDKWVVSQDPRIPWAGLKLFNIYGGQEAHKGKMASIVYNMVKEAKETGQIKVFGDGTQSRDLMYVEDLVDICIWFMLNPNKMTGLFNIGTGNAVNFTHLAKIIFKELKMEENIILVPIPPQVKGYQMFTKAPIEKLRAAGYTKEFIEIEGGVKKVIKEFI